MNNLGVALKSQRQLKEAIEAYTAAAKLNPNARLSRNNLFESTRIYVSLASAAAGIPGLAAIWLAVTVSDINRPAAVVLGTLGVAGLGGSVILAYRRRRTLAPTVQTFYLTERGREAPRVLKRLLLLFGLIVLVLVAVIVGAALVYGQLHV
jgi:hypothetical protein